MAAWCVSMPAELENDNTGASTEVFIVDPDEALARRLAALFNAMGATVRVFPSAEALLALPALTPACVVSELRLDGMNGIELIGALRKRHCAAPVILLSSNADVATAVSAMRAGALDFIEKPAIERLLTWHVGRLLEGGAPEET